MPKKKPNRKIRLFVNYFVHPDRERAKEIDACLLANLSCESIDEVVILTDKLYKILKGQNKIKKIVIGSDRPTYYDFFQAINEYTGARDINIVSNSDIVFNNTVELARNNLRRFECYSLTRWDIKRSGKLKFFNRNDSQDCWIFRGKVKLYDEYKVVVGGKAGCDNAIAHRLDKNGFRMLNISLSLIIVHVHLTKIRTYKVTDREPGIYKTLPIIHVNDV